MMLDQLPTKSIDLIEKLDKLYPDKCPNPSVSRDESMFRAGQRDVVNFLVQLKDRQDEEGLEKEMRGD